MASQPTYLPTPNTAFKRKPIPVNVTPPTPIGSRTSALSEENYDSACPRCGASASSHPASEDRLSGDYSQTRIRELETEVKIVTGKAMTAADKLADYEEELKNLRAARDTNTSLQSQQQTSNATRDPSPLQETTAQAITPPAPEAQLPNNPAPPTRPAMPLGRALTTTRLTNFLSARRGAPSPVSPADSTTPPPATDHPNSPMTADLTAQLNTSENARRAAEDKLTKTNAELEELSVSLFSQANEMVAKERIAFADREAQALERENTARDQEKAREQKAKEREVQWQEWQSEMKGRDKAMQLKVKRLEARVKTLEERDKEKGKRLERLESAMNRTIRIRRFLGAHQADCRP